MWNEVVPPKSGSGEKGKNRLGAPRASGARRASQKTLFLSRLDEKKTLIRWSRLNFEAAGSSALRPRKTRVASEKRGGRGAKMVGKGLGERASRRRKRQRSARGGKKNGWPLLLAEEGKTLLRKKFLPGGSRPSIQSHSPKSPEKRPLPSSRTTTQKTPRSYPRKTLPAKEFRRPRRGGFCRSSLI